jgi:hypothetical protein
LTVVGHLFLDRVCFRFPFYVIDQIEPLNRVSVEEDNITCS